MAQWAATARVRILTLPISRCPNERRLQVFAIRLSLFLGVPIFLYVPMSENGERRPLTLPISWCPNERTLLEFAVRLSLFLGVPMSRHCESSPLDFVFFSASQWAETGRVCFLTQFLSVPMIGDCESSAFHITNFSVSNERKLRESALNFANFLMSQWAENAKAHPLSQWAKTARVGPCFFQFLGVPMSGECESSIFDFANFSVFHGVVTARVRC